jgi:hypothetical protein
MLAYSIGKVLELYSEKINHIAFWNCRTFIQTANDERLGAQDRLALLEEIAANVVGKEVAWAQLRTATENIVNSL